MQKSITACFVLVLMLISAVLTPLPLKVGAAVNVPYTDENGNPAVTPSGLDVTEIDQSNIASYTTLTTGWYLMQGSINHTGTITINGDVHIILANGCDVSVTGDSTPHSGIHVPQSSALTIYGQPGGAGRLAAQGGDQAAGIGGGSLNPTAGSITINGGVIEATGGGGAGIGGGRAGNGGNIVINGGTVIAAGGGGSAGIGGGSIGSGLGGNGGNITITGGTVTATGGTFNGSVVNGAAGIGGGYSLFYGGGAGGNITITGGNITALGGVNAAGIGGGSSEIYDNSLSTGGFFGDGGNIKITGGIINATGIGGAAGIGGGAGGIAGIIEIGGEASVTAAGGTNTDNENGGAGIGSGGYVFTGVFNNQGVDNSITISGSTQVNAFGGYHAAGIGGSNLFSGGIITIESGNVTAAGKMGGAGIGGGSYTAGGSITIGGTANVTATGGNKDRTDNSFDARGGAGIGGGFNGAGGVIQIEDNAVVTAYGGCGSAGIGGGAQQCEAYITITGGTVVAYGCQYPDDGAAGIGAGGKGNSSGGYITISGGDVTAIGGGRYTPGIGGKGDAPDILIEGGTITAKAGSSGAGIGNGNSGNAKIEITGGTINAAGYWGGAGIGAAAVSSGKTEIIITGGHIYAEGDNTSGKGETHYDDYSGAGIGAGSQHTGDVYLTVTGGYIEAYALGGSDAAGVGAGSESPVFDFTFVLNGGAVIYASSVTEPNAPFITNGVLFDGAAGEVYGSPAPSFDWGVKTAHTLNIPLGAVLNIAAGRTLTNSGDIIISGAMANNGAVLCSTGGITGNKPSPNLAAYMGDVEFPFDVSANEGELLEDVQLTGGSSDLTTEYGFEWVSPPSTPLKAGEQTHTALLVWENTDNYLPITGDVTVNVEKYDPCESGHTFAQWKQLLAPSCEEKGSEYRECEFCGETEERELPALGHSYGDWYVTIPPTQTEEGEETRDCEREGCGHKETRAIPPTDDGSLQPPVNPPGNLEPPPGNLEPPPGNLEPPPQGNAPQTRPPQDGEPPQGSVQEPPHRAEEPPHPSDEQPTTADEPQADTTPPYYDAQSEYSHNTQGGNQNSDTATGGNYPVATPASDTAQPAASGGAGIGSGGTASQTGTDAPSQSDTPAQNDEFNAPKTEAEPGQGAANSAAGGEVAAKGDVSYLNGEPAPSLKFDASELYPRTPGSVYINIGGRQIILFASLSAQAWAFSNLFLFLFSVLLAVYAVIKEFTANRRELAGYNNEQTDMEWQYRLEEKEAMRRGRLAWLSVIGIAAIAGSLLFTLTQNTNTTTAVADFWTIVHIALIITQTAAFALIRNKKARLSDYQIITDRLRALTGEV